MLRLTRRRQAPRGGVSLATAPAPSGCLYRPLQISDRGTRKVVRADPSDVLRWKALQRTSPEDGDGRCDGHRWRVGESNCESEGLKQPGRGLHQPGGTTIFIESVRGCFWAGCVETASPSEN